MYPTRYFRSKIRFGEIGRVCPPRERLSSPFARFERLIETSHAETTHHRTIIVNFNCSHDHCRRVNTEYKCTENSPSSLCRVNYGGNNCKNGGEEMETSLPPIASVNYHGDEKTRRMRVERKLEYVQGGIHMLA
ncbi:hypothetical protein K0M31_017563 [Melipona bicolor]|uniref:Uncharacterized protein n=1 Tax=Melipona bicolor TaxID=60889 RepID=A0AA40KSS8_9HYME|nr:hypothetical protein K0M31_017563 [Melipona bicolor]